jgi:hypothetical protein
MRRIYSPIQGLGIESWESLLASQSHWFFWQMSRWRTRRITATTITTLITITTRGHIDSRWQPGPGDARPGARQQKTTRARQFVRY